MKTSLRRFIRSKAKSGEKTCSEVSSLSGSNDWASLVVLEVLERGEIDLAAVAGWECGGYDEGHFGL